MSRTACCGCARYSVPTVIETRAPGYRLAAPADAVDARRFEDLVALGRAARVNGTPDRARRQFREALGLWRGVPFEELEGWDPADAEAARLAELQRLAAEELMDAELACGHHVSCVAELERMVAAEPFRERRWAMLMLALYRCGRQAEALRAYQRARTALASELGIEPGTRASGARARGRCTGRVARRAELIARTRSQPW